jgi:hypothetical protein
VCSTRTHKLRALVEFRPTLCSKNLDLCAPRERGRKKASATFARLNLSPPMAKVKQREKRQLSSLSINPLFNYRSDRLLLFSFCVGFFRCFCADELHKFFLFLSHSVFIRNGERKRVFRPLLSSFSARFLMFPSEVCFILVWVNYLSHDSCAHRLRGHYNKLPQMRAPQFSLSVGSRCMCVMSALQFLPRRQPREAYCETGIIWQKHRAHAIKKKVNR